MTDVCKRCMNLHIQSDIIVKSAYLTLKDRVIFKGELGFFIQYYRNIYCNAELERFYITNIELKTATFIVRY